MGSGVLDDIKQQVGSLGKQLGKTVVSSPKAAAKTVASQIGFEVKEGQQKPPQEMAEKAKKENVDFVKELYGASDQKPKSEQANNPQQESTKKMTEANPGKTPEEIQKMMSLRQQLHQQTYYQKLTTAQKRPEEVQEDQERAAERIKRLEMEDLQKKKEDEKKKKPIAVSQAERKTEAPLGAG